MKVNSRSETAKRLKSNLWKRFTTSVEQGKTSLSSCHAALQQTPAVKSPTRPAIDTVKTLCVSRENGWLGWGRKDKQVAADSLGISVPQSHSSALRIRIALILFSDVTCGKLSELPKVSWTSLKCSRLWALWFYHEQNSNTAIPHLVSQQKSFFCCLSSFHRSTINRSTCRLTVSLQNTGSYCALGLADLKLAIAVIERACKLFCRPWTFNMLSSTCSSSLANVNTPGVSSSLGAHKSARFLCWEGHWWWLGNNATVTPNWTSAISPKR